MMVDRSLMAQLCSQLIFPFNQANFHLSDHRHVVYGNAPSQHPAGLDLGYTRDVPGSSPGTSLTYPGALPNTVANGQNTGNFCDFGNAKFRFFFFSVFVRSALFFSFRLNFHLFRFFCCLFRFFSRAGFSHITWATGAGCGFLSHCNVIGESLFGADNSMLRKHWENPKRRKVENRVLENRVWALQK